jgi:hypothetical protein
MENIIRQRVKIEQLLVEKAMKDALFRAQLILHPNETVEKEFDIKLPERTQVKVLEEDANTVYLIIPRQLSPETEG